MWNLINKKWSNETKMWFIDQLVEKRKTFIIEQIYQTFGFIQTFL